MTRPRRQNKSDRLISPGATNEEIRCDFALAPFDRAALDAERTWGIDRLPGLVSPQTAERYGRAVAHLNERIAASDPDGTASAAANCVRGLAAMEAEARAAGHQPLKPTVWQIVVGGRTCCLIRDVAEWPAVAAEHPGAAIYTLQEVSVALEHFGQIVVAAKDAFPGAQVTAVRAPTTLEVELEDQIPF